VCKSRTLSKPIFVSAATLFDVGVTHLYPRLRPRIREVQAEEPALPNARSRDGTLLQLQMSSSSHAKLSTQVCQMPQTARVLIYIRKEEAFDKVERRYPAKQHFLWTTRCAS